MQAVTLLRQDVVTAAAGLLGWRLSTTLDGVTTSGIIVETEAYRAGDDPASHAAHGQTKRNTPMWQEAGTIYVYLSYGLHDMLNLVTGPVGQAEAVLVRAIEPTSGLPVMRARRGLAAHTNLTNGPARLTQALAIGSALNGTHLRDGLLALKPPTRAVDPTTIVTATRIGISRGRDLPWRFYLSGNRYVSRY